MKISFQGVGGAKGTDCCGGCCWWCWGCCDCWYWCCCPEIRKSINIQHTHNTHIQEKKSNQRKWGNGWERGSWKEQTAVVAVVDNVDVVVVADVVDVVIDDDVVVLKLENQ